MRSFTVYIYQVYGSAVSSVRSPRRCTLSSVWCPGRSLDRFIHRPPQPLLLLIIHQIGISFDADHVKILSPSHRSAILRPHSPHLIVLSLYRPVLRVGLQFYLEYNIGLNCIKVVKLFAMPAVFLLIFCSPSHHHVQNGFQVIARFRQSIFHPRRHFRIHFPGEQTAVLHKPSMDFLISV